MTLEMLQSVACLYLNQNGAGMKDKGGAMEHWWLNKDCTKCIMYPDCDFIELLSPKQRGCSLYRRRSDKTMNRREKRIEEIIRKFQTWNRDGGEEYFPISMATAEIEALFDEPLSDEEKELIINKHYLNPLRKIKGTWVGKLVDEVAEAQRRKGGVS